MNLDNINLGDLSTQELEQVKLMLDIQKIQSDINESLARSRQADATLEQIRITVAKMEKEKNWFPWLQILTTVIASGAVAFLLTHYLSK